jgi:trehalose 6-phosphate phosphatase
MVGIREEEQTRLTTAVATAWSASGSSCQNAGIVLDDNVTMTQERERERIEGRDGFPSVSPFSAAELPAALPVGLTLAQVALLRQALSQRPRGLLLDIDGTISPIAPTPEGASLLPGMPGLLERAADVFEVLAVITGRDAADARRMVGVDRLLYIGNHGMERWLPGESAPQIIPEARPYLPAIAQALEEAERDLTPRLPGARFERKGVSGSIHTRGCIAPQQALTTVLATLRPLTDRLGLRLTEGKLVAEIRPPLAVNKGTAVEGLVQSRGLRSAIYLGDDTTDIDAFRALRHLREAGACAGLAVAVLQAEAPPALAAEADLALPSIQAVPAFLEWALAAASA